MQERYLKSPLSAKSNINSLILVYNEYKYKKINEGRQ